MSAVNYVRYDDYVRQEQKAEKQKEDAIYLQRSSEQAHVISYANGFFRITHEKREMPYHIDYRYHSAEFHLTADQPAPSRAAPERKRLSYGETYGSFDSCQYFGKPVRVRENEAASEDDDRILFTKHDNGAVKVEFLEDNSGAQSRASELDRGFFKPSAASEKCPESFTQRAFFEVARDDDLEHTNMLLATVGHKVKIIPVAVDPK